jgi:hypothetical protein
MEKRNMDQVDKVINARWAPHFFGCFSLVILVAIALTGYGLLRIPDTYRNSPDVTLPVLILVSTVGLLMALSFVASAFSALDLSNKSEALGLPEGSVRALIALLLITLFVVATTFLYRQLRGEEIAHYIGISEEQLAQIPSDQVISIEVITEEETGQVFNVDRRVPALEGSEASQRFAEQLLTTISTLVTAVAAFYFGTRSVAEARGEAVSAPPFIRRVDPVEGKQGQTIDAFKISGKNFQPPMKVKLASGPTEMTFADLLSNDTQISFKLIIPSGQLPGKYDLTVVNADGGEDFLPDAFEVCRPDSPPGDGTQPDGPKPGSS